MSGSLWARTPLLIGALIAINADIVDRAGKQDTCIFLLTAYLLHNPNASPVKNQKMELLTEWEFTVGKTILKILYLGLHGFSPDYDVIIFTDESMIIIRMESGDYHSRDGIVGSYCKFKEEPEQLFHFLIDNSIFPTSIKLKQYSWESEEKFLKRIKENGTDSAT